MNERDFRPPASVWSYTPDDSTGVDAAALPSQPALPEGPRRLTDRYEVLGELGTGGIGRVYLVRDRQLRREVALKVLRAGSTSALASRRFQAEAQVTAQLSHPNIVPVYDSGTLPSGELYVAMKVIEGSTLRAVLEEHAQRPTKEGLSRVLRILIDVARALTYAHRRGVVHRDLKPENVMIGRFDETVVMDWGLAKHVGRPTDEGGDPVHLGGEADTRTLEGSLVGTVHYMSPEQVAGDPSAVDSASDVWAMGVILHEALSGTKPFEGRTYSQVLAAIEEARVSPASRLGPRVPPELAAIVAHCLARDKADRYGDASDLADDLARWLEGRSVSVHRDSLPRRAEKFVRRNPISSALAALVVATGVGAAIWVSAVSEEARAEVDEARSKAGAREEALLAANELADEVDRWAWPRDLREEAEVRARFDEVIALAPDRSFPWRRRGIWYFNHRLPGRGCAPLTPAEVEARAEADLRRAVELDPRDYYAWYFLYQIERDRKAVAEAEACLERMVACAPANELRAAAIGFRLTDRAIAERTSTEAARLHREAIAAYDEAERYNPDCSMVWLGRGLSRLMVEDLAGSIDDHDRYLARDPGDAKALVHRGIARLGLGRHDEALADFERALSIDPRLVLALGNRARLHRERGDRKAALADYDRALELDPSDLDVRHNRGCVRREEGDVTGALADLDEVLRLDPEWTLARANRGITRQIGADLPGAIADLDRALAEDPSSAEAWYARGLAHEGLGHAEEAVHDFDEAAARRPDDYRPVYQRAVILVGLGRTDRAMADFERAVLLRPEAAVVWMGRGNMRASLGDYARAVEDYDRALAIDPAVADVWFNRAQALRGLDRPADAIADFTRAIERHPTYLQAWAERGSVRWEVGDWSGAAEDWETLLRLVPDHPQAGEIREAAADARRRAARGR